MSTTSSTPADYLDFLEEKVNFDHANGYQVALDDIHPMLKDHQRAIVQWAVAGGRRAIFAAFGLGKTFMQLETVRLTLAHTGGSGLIVLPLGVRQEFTRDAATLSIPVTFIRSAEQMTGPGIYITNYESIRDGKLDPNLFNAASLDEASVLRSYGSKTFQTFLTLFDQVKHRFVATATPSPNRYKELIHYAGFLGVMDTGQALAQPVDANVLTPAGWRLMGELAVGDDVISVDGTPTSVLGVYPQGEKPIYRITFSDGATTECTGDHLWLTRTQYERNNARRFALRNPDDDASRYWTVKDTTSIAATLRCESTGSTNHQVPLVQPVEFPPRPVAVDPWLMGVLIGDGCLRDTSVSLTSADDWIIQHAHKLVVPLGLAVTKVPHVRADGQPNYDYLITGGKSGRGGRGHHTNAVLAGMRSYGLLGKRAWEKRIPADYLLNDAKVRLAVLQGLMDADGTIAADPQNRTTRLCTTSAGLAEDVTFIVQSLGGTASTAVRGGRTPTGGQGRDKYIVTMRLPNGTNPFALPRKADLVIERLKYGPVRYITAVESVGVKSAQCIAVAHPARLYVTDDLVVTHNTRFFQRDSTQANNLTLYPHKEREFWLWLSTWAIFLQKPSDLGFDDTGYDLPELEVVFHEVAVDHSDARPDRDGQVALFRGGNLGVSDAAREKRDTLAERVAVAARLVAEAPADHFILWHDLEDERRAIKQAIPETVEVFGQLDLDIREQRVIDFSDGKIRLLATKPELSGSGCNFQRHCHRAIFVGVGFKFNDFIQALHRIHRFLQTEHVRIDIIHAESEREVVRTLQRKWDQHKELTATMSNVIRQHGLNQVSVHDALTRSIGVERIEASGQGWLVANNDCVDETRSLADNSVDLIVTSIPFSNHYEYTPSYNDFGHTDDNDHFWAQMDFLTPELLRVLRPGRIYACHVKDRILFGNTTGAGVPTSSPFHAEALMHGRKHGFDYLGMITVVTDVVRENNQTYRLGWSEQCKDGTKMGVGSPEYILLFHKPQTDRTRGYADVPVVKSKAEYTRARWQVDAHAFWRSSGDRNLTPDELAALPADQMSRLFTEQTLRQVYDYESHIRVGEALEAKGALPATFMAIAPGSHHSEVWTDVNRMLTLNTEQSRRAQTMHVCLAWGSLVLTYGGYKPIQEVTPGELVLTHKGRWRPVLAVQNTGVRPVVRLRAQGVPGLTLTPDHKVWARDSRRYARQADYMRKAEPGWLEASEAVGAYVNRKLPACEATGLSQHHWWVVGRWLADGHWGVRGDLSISCGSHEMDDLRARLGEIAGKSYHLTGGEARQIRLRDRGGQLRRTIKACGQGAAAKHLPPEAYTLPPDEARALLDGYLSGDGHFLPGRCRWLASSVSRELLLGMAFLAQRAYGATASIYPGRGPRAGYIMGRPVSMQQDWIFCFDLQGGGRRKGSLLLDDGAWMRVRSADPVGDVETWNLRVEEDESYTAENMIVKNCPLQFDIVDRLIGRYSNPGELVYDPFGGLFTVPVRALHAGRLGRAVELNPGYFLDGVKYLQAKEREVDMPGLFELVGAEAEVPA